MGRLEIFLVLTFPFFIYLQRVESACGESDFLAKVLVYPPLSSKIGVNLLQIYIFVSIILQVKF